MNKEKFAIIQTGGKQYKVSKDSLVSIEKIKGEYKAGDKTMIIYIPDMIVFDPARNQIVNVEGKKYSTRKQGIEDLKNYTYIEKKIIKPSHSPDSIIRTVAIFGSQEKSIKERQIGFMLNENGEMILGKQSPEIFKEAIEKASGL